MNELEPLAMNRDELLKALRLTMTIVAADPAAVANVWGDAPGSFASTVQFCRHATAAIESGGNVPPIVNQAAANLAATWPAIRAAHACAILVSLGVAPSTKEMK